MSTRKFHGRQAGFSLVELMVAMSLSLVLLAGALSILYSSKVTYAENERLARLQENGRAVVELILRDARASGFHGCVRPQSPDDLVNALRGSNTLLWNLTQPMFGFDANGGAWQPALDAAVVPGARGGSDVIVLRTSRQGMPVFRVNAPVTNETADISVVGPAGATLEPGSTVVISDCQGSSVFAVTSFEPGPGNTAIIRHAAGAGDGTNLTTSLERGSFLVNAQVSPIDTVIYYVREDANGPALWRRIGAADPEPLIPGVENLQVRYGVDTDGDLLVNQYVTANNVTDWNRVVALTLSVLVRSETETNLERDGRTYTVLDTNLGPFNDRHQRSVFTTTVVLRNKTT